MRRSPGLTKRMNSGDSWFRSVYERTGLAERAPGVGKPRLDVGLVHRRRAAGCRRGNRRSRAGPSPCCACRRRFDGSDAAPALGGRVGFGLPGKIDADHFRRQWEGIDVAPEPCPAATARRAPETRSLHPTHETTPRGAGGCWPKTSTIGTPLPTSNAKSRSTIVGNRYVLRKVNIRNHP